MWGDHLRCEPTIDEIFASFHLRKLPDNHGQFYVYDWEDLHVVSRPRTLKSWKDRWFFVSGDWEFQDDDKDIRFRVPRHFRKPKWPHRRPVLRGASLTRLERICNLPIEARDSESLVTWDNLHRYGIDSK